MRYGGLEMAVSVSFQVEQCLEVILDDGSHFKTTALGVNICNFFHPVDAPCKSFTSIVIWSKQG
jgi:hypothetical protein